jgi:hypothetical protein
LRRSFSVTSAARISRLVLKECASADRVLIEQGAMTMPSWRKEPLEMQAPTSFNSCTCVASAFISSMLRSVS